MTLSEFKIWFEGFMEGANAVGDKTQIIKSKLDKVNKGPSYYEIPLKPYFPPVYGPSSPPLYQDQTVPVAKEITSTGFPNLRDLESFWNESKSDKDSVD